MAKRHPVEITYDEMQRSLRRLQQYLNNFRKDLTEEEVKNIQDQMESIEQTIETIPEKYCIPKHKSVIGDNNGTDS